MIYTARTTPDGAAQHIISYNIQFCKNALHGYHRIPTIPNLPPDPELLQHAAEYVDIALGLFDEATGTNVDKLSAVEVLDRELKQVPAQPEDEVDDIGTESTT